MKRALSVILALCMVLALCACGQQAAPDSSATEPSADYVPVTVENYGRTITIEKMPEKVVTALPTRSSEIPVTTTLAARLTFGPPTTKPFPS